MQRLFALVDALGAAVEFVQALLGLLPGTSQGPLDLFTLLLERLLAEGERSFRRVDMFFLVGGGLLFGLGKQAVRLVMGAGQFAPAVAGQQPSINSDAYSKRDHSDDGNHKNRRRVHGKGRLVM